MKLIRIIVGAFFGLLFLPLQIVHGQDNEMKVAERIDALIKVFAHPEAQADNIDETARAIQELTTIGKPAVPPLMKAILGKNQVVALYGALTLDKIGRPAVEIVRGNWPNWTEAEKWHFMRFRGKFDYLESVDFAHASLTSKSERVRRQAIEHFGLHKDGRARPQLLKMLNTEIPELHRWLVLESVAAIGNSDASADALIALLAKDSWAAKGKGLIHPLGHAPPFWPDGRIHVIKALGKMGARKAAPKLLEVIQEKEPNKGLYFSREIVRLLGEWNYVESIPELKRLLVSKNEWGAPPVNVAAVLLQLKDRSGTAVLLQALRSKYDTERIVACKAFAEHGDQRDVLILGGCLDHPGYTVQELACHGLERITGVVNREPGQTMHTSADIPLWKAWFEQNKAKYQSGN